MSVVKDPPRREHRDDWPIAVPVACGRCSRTIAELYGTTDGPAAFWSRQAAGGLIRYGRCVRWVCHRCRADYPVRGEKLVTAWRTALTRQRPRIVLPRDVSGAPGTSPFVDRLSS